MSKQASAAAGPRSDIFGQPGCSPIHQSIVAGGIEEQVRDPVDGLGARIAGELDDVLWQRGGFGEPVPGCEGMPAGEIDDFCRRELLLTDVPVRVRCDPATDSGPDTCSWNLEADRVALLPSRLEIVLAHRTTDATVTALTQVGGRTAENILCRTALATLETGEVAGALGWHPAVLE